MNLCLECLIFSNTKGANQPPIKNRPDYENTLVFTEGKRHYMEGESITTETGKLSLSRKNAVVIVL